MQPLALLSNVPAGDGGSQVAGRSGAAGAAAAGAATVGVTGFGTLVEGMVAATPGVAPVVAPPAPDITRGDLPVDGTVMAGLLQALTPQAAPTGQPPNLGGEGLSPSGLPPAPAGTPGLPVTGAAAPTAAPLTSVSLPTTSPADGPAFPLAAAAPAAPPAMDAAPAAPQAAAPEMVPPPAGLMSLAATQAVAAGLVPATGEAGPAAPTLRAAPVIGSRDPRGRNEGAPTAANGGASAITMAQARPALALRAEAVAPVPTDAANDGATTLTGAPAAAGGDAGLAAPAAASHLAPREVAAPHATAMARAASGHAAPAQQVVGRIEQAIQNGQTTLTVKLDPDHLGRVEVKLELQDGRVSALITAERPATLDLLQRDARLIERAMEQGGMQVQPDGLHFSLSDGNAQWAESGQGRRGARLYGEQVQADPAPDPLTPVASRSDSLVDIQI